MATVKVKLRKNRLNKKGVAPLVIRVISNRQHAEVSLKKLIEPLHWNHEKDELRKTHPNYSTLSTFIANEKHKVQDIVNKFRLKGNEPTAQEIINTYSGGAVKSPETISTIIENHIEDNPDKLGWGTLKYYKTAARRWRECFPCLTISKLEKSHLVQFEKYLRVQCNNDVNTIHNRLKVIRKIAKAAHRDGIVKKDPFIHHPLRTKQSNRTYLTRHELKLVEGFQPRTNLLQEVKDVFLFSCYTGLRFSDLCTLTEENFLTDTKDDVQICRLQLRIAKTQDLLSFRLPRKCESILLAWKRDDWPWSLPILKYIRYPNDSTLKNAISARNALYNKVLKTIAEESGIQKNISFHSARHTMATLGLSLGVSMEVVGKLLGHKNLQTTQIYARVLDQAKDDAIAKLDSI